MIVRMKILSFAEGSFPSLFKIAQVTPVVKKVEVDTFEQVNDRIVSNLDYIRRY